MLKMAYRAFEGLLSGVFDSEVAYLTYDQYYVPLIRTGTYFFHSLFFKLDIDLVVHDGFPNLIVRAECS